MSLQKLKIQSFNSADCTGKPLKTIYAMVNPENYSQDYKVLYKERDVIGDSAKSLFFAGMGVNELSINKLIVDGTGTVPLEGADDVDDYISQFKNTVYTYNGTLHAPAFIKLTWGAKNLTFKGVCSALKIEYKLFKPDGSTLRAFINFTIKANSDFTTKEMEAGKNSPDLSHLRTAQAGDTLPLMTYKIYNSSSFYMDVAKKNNLNSVYDVQPGKAIYFYPLKKK